MKFEWFLWLVLFADVGCVAGSAYRGDPETGFVAAVSAVPIIALLLGVAPEEM